MQSPQVAAKPIIMLKPAGIAKSISLGDEPLGATGNHLESIDLVEEPNAGDSSEGSVKVDTRADGNLHSSQVDYKYGFGGKFGVQGDRMDKSAYGWDEPSGVEQHKENRMNGRGGGRAHVSIDFKREVEETLLKTPSIGRGRRARVMIRSSGVKLAKKMFPSAPADSSTDTAQTLGFIAQLGQRLLIIGYLLLFFTIVNVGFSAYGAMRRGGR